MHPLESDGCRKENQDFDGEANGTDKEHVVQNINTALLRKRSPALRVLDVSDKTEVLEQHSRHQDRELVSGGPQRHSGDSLADALVAG